MNNFIYYTPTKIVFGPDTESRVGELAASFGAKKVLVHYGSERVVKSGLIGKIETSLDMAAIEHIRLGGVVANPRVSLVRKGVKIAKEENVDMIIAVGGGSVIDSSKAIAYGAKYDGDVWDIYDHNAVPESALPVGVVLTMAASGSEMSDSSVITNEENMEKRGYNNDMCRPAFSILDPKLTLTLPPYQTACGCVDILMHTFERYFTSKGNMEITDQISEGLFRTVMKAAVILRDHPDDLDARAEVMWAGSLSHNGLTECGDGGKDFATHRLEHELSAKFDVTHGAGLAAIWGSWARYVFDSCPDRFYRYAVNVINVKTAGLDGMGGDESRRTIGLKGIEATESFFRSLKMPTNLQELGIEMTDEDLQDMARRCAYVNGGHIGKTRVLEESDMLAIYRNAWKRGDLNE